MREAYQRRLPSDTSKDYYFIHRNSGVTEPIIVEYGFLDSTSDDVSQLKNNWRKYVEAVVKGVSEYVDIKGNEGSTEIEGLYTVKSGDTLYNIARKYNTTVSEIKQLNNLTSNNLSIGEQLIIPTIEEPNITPSDNTYTVKSGDTLYEIAKKYNTTINELMFLNNLTSTALKIGQVLKLPTTEIIETEESIYTVKSGDTLYKIAKLYDVNIADLINANNLTTNVLSVGQQLIIPTTQQEEYITYTVKSGDNLYSIARKYNTTVSELMNLNNLTTNLLNIGQTLRVPTNSSDTNIYTVKSGDTLYSIARQYGTTVTDIINKNNLTNQTLSIGQQLII